WLEVADALNCGMMFKGSPADAAQTGKYPNFVSTTLPALLPWQRRQFSYWLTAGVRTVSPSPALIPTTEACEERSAGGEANVVTGVELCGLWQSTQVAWRLLLRTALSARSWTFVPVAKGWLPAFANSAKTFGATGETLEPPLWQARQACSSFPRSRRARA